jgi:alpha-beta hydrolase superfamily lysophospholipase
MTAPEARSFTDAHGIRIFYDVHPARVTPRGVVQLLHGVGEHAGRYSSAYVEVCPTPST